ncbi:hypothetical protein ABZU32_35660 [Sphaerisporangium sp. NPDC005288]|uniref:hypothetical protein n=1 Tax=Sphaerisporangium sp. NPDC005288 TaxID=3155114 RepID=UPI0033B2DBC0
MGRVLVACGCRAHKGRACEVAAGSELAAATAVPDARLAERNRHTLVLLAEHDQTGEQGPWPIGGRR